MKHAILLFFLLLFAISGFGQNTAHNVIDGNKAYRNKEYDKAASLYRKSLEQKSEYDFQARYNLANTMYKSGDFEGARKVYSGLLSDSLDNRTQSRLYHNIGNTFMQEKQYEQSVQAYKNALKYNPSDEDSRYNLSYALQMLKKQQQSQQNQNQQNQDKQNQDKQNQDKKDQQNKDQNKDKQEQDKKDNPEKNQPEQQKNEKNEISAGQADQMLKALQNKEKQTQREIHVQPVKEGQGSGSGYKDW